MGHPRARAHGDAWGWPPAGNGLEPKGGRTEDMHGSATNASAGLESWLVSCNDSQKTLSTLRTRFDQDPGATVEREIQLSDGSVILVVAMSEETAQRYRQEFKDQCHIERNRPLQSFS